MSLLSCTSFTTMLERSSEKKIKQILEKEVKSKEKEKSRKIMRKHLVDFTRRGSVLVQSHKLFLRT